MHSEHPTALPWLTAGAAASIMLTLSARVVAPLTVPGTPEDGVVLASWWATTSLAAWLVSSVILWSIALRSKQPRTARFAARFALPGTRKLAESALALALMVAPAACTAGASEAPTLSLVAQGAVVETSSATSLPPIAPTTTTSAPQAESVEVADDLSPAVADQDSTVRGDPPPPYEVQCGDNLWEIAESQLSVQLGRGPSSSEVAPYWRELVNLNRGSLRSGEPDLIFPGELIALPADG